MTTGAELYAQTVELARAAPAAMRRLIELALYSGDEQVRRDAWARIGLSRAEAEEILAAIARYQASRASRQPSG